MIDSISKIEAYQYSRIVVDDTIRLILLEPSQDVEAQIQCSLIETRLHDLDQDIVEHYVALSYVWGDGKARSVALVDGKQLEITASLDFALRHLRDSTRVLRIWADGICINQSCNEDRNRQVTLMCSIYSFARHTVIFLGRSTPEIDTIVGSIAINNAIPRSELADAERAHWDATVENKVLANPWFSRVWVLQELVLSADPWIQFGDTRVRWSVFYDYLFSEPRPAFQDAIERRISSMHQIKARHKSDIVDRKIPVSPSIILLATLQSRRGAGVTDPRDMIYGHVGLLGHKAKDVVKVDYEKPVSQLYEDVARAFLMHDEIGLIFLHNLETKTTDYGSLVLPSWVPDWTVPWKSFTELNSSTLSSKVKPMAGRILPLCCTIPHTIALYGYVCDRVLSIAQMSESFSSEWISRVDAQKLMSTIVKLFYQNRRPIIIYSSDKPPTFNEPDKYGLRKFILGLGISREDDIVCLIRTISHILPDRFKPKNKYKQIALLSSGVAHVIEADVREGDFILNHGNKLLLILRPGSEELPELSKRKLREEVSRNGDEMESAVSVQAVSLVAAMHRQSSSVGFWGKGGYDDIIYVIQ